MTLKQDKRRNALNRLQQVLIEKLGGKCRGENCNKRTKLDFAHVKITKLCGESGRGKSRRMYDIKKHLTSYILLCKPCHRAFDTKHGYRHVLPPIKVRRY